MKNIYNKGRLRNGEWAKHLRPFLKRGGNKRWRRTGKRLEGVDFDVFDSTVGYISKSSKRKPIKVLFKVRSFGEYTFTYTARYHSIRSANDAMKRMNIIDVKIVNKGAVANKK